MAAMITVTARPSGPPVSSCSRKLTNSTPRRFSSSRVSRKWRTERQPVAAPDDQHLELALAGVAHQPVQAGAGGAGARDPVLVDTGDLQSALRGHLAQVMQLGLGMLIQGGNSQVQGSQRV